MCARSVYQPVDRSKQLIVTGGFKQPLDINFINGRVIQMKKIAVVYWSGTGNTKAMAEAVTEGIDNAGAESVVLKSAEFSAEDVVKYDGIAFGCPSMGVEQLEESEFEPMFINCEPHLKAKNIALFGSYDWGDGEWMRTWEET